MLEGRVLIIGIGDVTRRFSLRLGQVMERGEIVLAGRRRDAHLVHTALADACSRVTVRFVELDAADTRAVEVVLARERPTLVIQAASAISPWLVYERTDATAVALRSAGFGVQLPAQLLILAAVMRAIRQVGFTGPVINCSFPDATHPVLAANDLAPTIGIGNAAMIAARVCASLRAESRASDTGDIPRVRVLAHHAQMAASMGATPPDDKSLWPRVYIGPDFTRRDELAYASPALPANRMRNELTAATMIPVAAAFLGAPGPHFVSTPAPLGLPGGYPVRIESGRVTLDLPPDTSQSDAVAYNQFQARADGIESVDGDGTVHFTDHAIRAVSQLAPGLTEPLEFSQLEPRNQLFLQVMGR